MNRDQKLRGEWLKMIMLILALVGAKVEGVKSPVISRSTPVEMARAPLSFKLKDLATKYSTFFKTTKDD